MTVGPGGDLPALPGWQVEAAYPKVGGVDVKACPNGEQFLEGGCPRY